MESTNQGFPLGGNPSPFSSWGDVGAPHMATFSLLGLTIGLPIWLFSTSVIQNTAIPEQLLKLATRAKLQNTFYNTTINLPECCVQCIAIDRAVDMAPNG